MSDIIIIDYGSGNLHSAFKAVKKAAEISGKGKIVKLTDSPKDLDSASHIILPGVGSFKDCAKGLNAVDGMVDALKENVLVKNKLFLGICVGMQLLAERGLEDSEDGQYHKGLGFIKGEVSKINPSDKTFKIPHMGWNEVNEVLSNKLTMGLSGKDFYYVHSYSMKTDSSNIIATSDYAEEIVAVINKGNIFGTQFHPEKSQENGIKLLTNFVNM